MSSGGNSALLPSKKFSNMELINLEVKFLTQQFGTSNQWSIRAEGRVSFSDLVIRVHELVKEEDNYQGKEGGSLGEIVLEDVISLDTPFVGENCCIVWNSVDQQLSLCLMFASEEGYAASWSALVAMQEKPYPSFGFDLLQRCSATAFSPLPYSTIIHNDYERQLGFIERHAISLSILENHHYKDPGLFSNRETVLALLEIANLDLLECLVSPDIYSQLCSSLGCEECPPQWAIPTSLTKLQVADELVDYIVKDINLTHLQEEVVIPKKSPDAIGKMTLLGERFRNELACSLLSGDHTLSAAKEALMIMPVTNSDELSSVQTLPSGLRLRSLYFQREVLDKMGFSKPEQQVLAHLHFFRFLVQFCITELGSDCAGAVILKIFNSGLLEALSFVAERYALPKGLSASFLPGLQEDRTNRDSRYSPFGENISIQAGPICFNPVIEYELAYLLDATITRLNERQEDQLMNDIIRSPILADPVKYNGLMAFLFRQLLTEEKRGEKDRAISDGIGVRNPFLLLHILGLHDRDGPATEEREEQSSAELSSRVQELFQSFVIAKYIPLASRGMLAVPVSTSSRDAPLVQFQMSNPVRSHLYLPQGISPAFIRVLEYLCLQSSGENRTALLKAIFNRKSLILPFVEGCFAITASSTRAMRQDVICGNVRFLKAVLCQLIPTDPNPVFDKNSKLTADQCISRNIAILVCRALTVERDTLGAVLHAYHHFGGHRRSSVFHSSVLSLLDLLAKKPETEKISDEGYDLRDMRDFIFFKHLKYLPPLFVEQFRQMLLAETTARLGEETGYLGSVSVLSSIAGSELMRSNSKLRFVDEVEAARGGVDGTVEPSSLNGLSPTVVANMIDTEEEKARKRRHATLASILTNSGSSVARTGGTLNLPWSSSEQGVVPPLAPAKAPDTKLLLKPPSIQSENQSPARQQRAIRDDDGEAKRRADSNAPPPGSDGTITLPRIKRKGGIQSTPAKP